jgi:hypothetical protein
MKTMFSFVRLVLFGVGAGLAIHLGHEYLQPACTQLFEGVGSAALSCVVSVGLAVYQRQRPPIRS